MALAKKKRTWMHTIRFMSTFRSLTYRGVHLNELLFRDFQRFCHKYHHLFPSPTKPISLRSLQKKSARYFNKKQKGPDFKRNGYTIIRAEFYRVAQKAKREKFLYIAHRKKEYAHLRTIPSCRPLVYLPGVKAPIHKKARQHVEKKLRTIYRAKQTPSYFKKPTFKKWMRKNLKLAMRMLDKTSRVFKRYPIKQVLYGSTLNSHGSLISSYAKRKQIPTINLQHGIFGDFGHLPVNADLNLVWGTSHARYLIRRGADPKRIKVIGPIFCRSTDGRRLRKRNSFFRSGRALRLLIALQPLGMNYNIRFIRTIDRAVARLGKQIQVIYKMHPSQLDDAPFKRVMRHPSSFVVKHRVIPLYNLIQQADLIITPFSTVAYEALIERKPVLFYGKRKRLYFLKGQLPTFQTSQQLLKWLTHFTTEQSIALPRLAKGDARLPISVWGTIERFRQGREDHVQHQQKHVSEQKQPADETCSLIKIPISVQKGERSHE